MARPAQHQYLMSGLLEGWDWFDNSLQNLVKAAGFRPLNKSQSMMVLYVSSGVQRPIEIARRMRLSRQAIRHIANQLAEIGILTATDDPDDGRSKVLAFTDRSMALRHYAHESILGLEIVLGKRIGRADVAALKRLLNMDWGPTVKSPAEVGGLRVKQAAPPQRRRPAKAKKKSRAG